MVRIVLPAAPAGRTIPPFLLLFACVRVCGCCRMSVFSVKNVVKTSSTRQTTAPFQHVHNQGMTALLEWSHMLV